MAISSSKGKLAILVTLSLLLGLTALPAQGAWGTIVDNFDTSQAPITANDVNRVVYGYKDGTMLGGERDLKVECTSGECEWTVLAGASSSKLSHSQGDNAYGYTLVTWDGNDGLSSLDCTTGFGVTDLTSSGAMDRIHVIGLTADQTGANLILRVYTDCDNWSVATESNIPALTSPADFQFVFSGASSDFVTGSGATGPANFNQVRAITLELDGRSISALDMSIDIIAADGPTAVDMASFTAAPAGGDVLLTWETASEVDLLGFNLYRSDAVDRNYVQLNDALILARHRGQPIGDVYTWSDGNVQAGSTYYYRLEALELGGGVSSFGPISATAEGLPMLWSLPGRPRPVPLSSYRHGR